MTDAAAATIAPPGAALPAPRPAPSLAEAVLAAAACAACAVLLYGSAVKLWWTYDDFYCIHILTGRPLLAAFSPDAWRQPRMFTPMLLLSFGADLRAFGLRPGAFYAHQLAALAAAGLSLHLLLRTWLPIGAAALATLLALSGPPVAAWVQELLVRHYIEGLLLAAASVGAFVAAVRRGRAWLAASSAVLYMAAMLEKEVYVPLAVLLVLLPEGSPRARLRAAVPHAIALAAYLAWRRAVIGTLAGGYGWTIDAREAPSLALALPLKLGAAFLGGSPPANALLAFGLAAGIAAALRLRRGAAPLFLAGLALAAAPVFPVSKAFQPRYAGLAWIAAAVAFGFGVQSLLERGAAARAGAWAAAAAAVVGTLLANRSVWDARYAVAERMSAEGRSFLAMAAGDLLRAPAIPPAAMHELRWLKESRLGLRAGSGWFADDLYVCDAARPVRRLLEYSAATRSVEDATARLPAIRSRYRAALRDAPLRADFSHPGDDFAWRLGPYRDGRYSIVYDGGVERYDVAAEGGYRHHADLLSLRVRYEAPEGWVTFSPEIALDLRFGRTVHWERPSGGTP